MTTQVLGITLQPSHTIGRAEFSGPGFRNPVAMARGADDLIYVVSRSYEYRPDGKRVTICTIGEDYVGEFARGVTTAGEGEASSADGSLIWPTAIALDREGNVYVADEWLNRISIFTGEGAYLSKWGTPGSGNGEISNPSGLAFDQDDNLYLVDSENHRVQRFTWDGKYLSQFGRKGNGDGEFNMPWGIAIDRHGDIFIADWRNDRIQKFAPDGRFLMKFGTSGAGEGELDRPTGVAVDKDGYIYVADWGNDRLQVFSARGEYVTQTTGDGAISKWGKDKLDANSEMWQERDIAQGLERERQFWGPVAVAVDDDDNVFVVESARSRIQIYRRQLPTFFGGRL